METIARGEIAEGFDKLDAMGAIREIDDSERHAQLAAEYLEAGRRGKTALVVSPTHRERERVTELIRTALRGAEVRPNGRISGEDRGLLRLKSTRWTEAERRDERRFAVGQVLQFHQHSGQARSGERYRVVQADGQVLIENDAGQQMRLAEVKAKHFDVFEAGEVAVAAGDLLRITRNGKTADGRHRLHNGAVYLVKGFTDAGDLELTNGWIVARDFGHLAHGYATTSHASQGRTVDRVIIAQGSESFVAASREQFYVSVSRARESVSVYTDDREGLLASVQESGRRMSATELLAPHAELEASSRWDRLKAHAVRVRRWAVQGRDYAGRQVEAARERLLEWRDRARGREPDGAPHVRMEVGP